MDEVSSQLIVELVEFILILERLGLAFKLETGLDRLTLA